MTRTPLTTENHETTQKNRPVRWRQPDHIVLHHWASTNWSNIVGMMVNRTRTVSSNVIIQNERIGSMMEEEDRSWSLSSALWDGRSLTAECGNSSVGGSWPLSPETHETIARWVADACGRYGIPIDRTHVMGHREVFTRHKASYATACPGGMDLEWIVTRAREIAGQGEAPAIIVPAAPAEPGGLPTGTFNGYLIRDIQRLLSQHGHATAVDGIYGPNTRAKVREFQGARGLTVDGIVGPNTWASLIQVKTPTDSSYNGYSVRQIQTLLSQRGFATSIDGVYGPDTATKVRAFQRSQGILADGLVGPVTWGRLSTPQIPVRPIIRPLIKRGATGIHVRYLQQKLGGLRADGIFGPATDRAVRAFQARVGITADGVVGPVTWSRLG